MTFADKCIQDGKLTVAGERACEIVFEKLTGKKYREYLYCPRVANKASHVPCYIKDRCTWSTCDAPLGVAELAFSLDAWRPIWEEMRVDQKIDCSQHLKDAKPYGAFFFEVEPIHHLEAALRALGEYEQWEAICG